MFRLIYGPNIDGDIPKETCYERDAVRYTEEIEGETVEYYALPEGREVSEFTVEELSEEETDALGKRLIDRLEIIHESPFMYVKEVKE